MSRSDLQFWGLGRNQKSAKDPIAFQHCLILSIVTAFFPVKEPRCHGSTQQPTFRFLAGTGLGWNKIEGETQTVKNTLGIHKIPKQKWESLCRQKKSVKATRKAVKFKKLCLSQLVQEKDHLILHFPEFPQKPKPRKRGIRAGACEPKQGQPCTLEWKIRNHRNAYADVAFIRNTGYQLVLGFHLGIDLH